MSKESRRESSILVVCGVAVVGFMLMLLSLQQDSENGLMCGFIILMFGILLGFVRFWLVKKDIL